MIVLRVLLFATGMAVVARTLLSAVLTFVLPRAVTDGITRWVFLRMRLVFAAQAYFASTYEDTDAIWALFAPVTLLLLPVVWIVLVVGGYAAMFGALGADGWQASITLSGSSLLTLGFAVPRTFSQTMLSFSEAVIGLGQIAILIAYLPTIYSAWSRREALVTMLEVRAGTPPTPVVLFRRYLLLGRLDRLTELWTQWEVWFADIEETHTSLAALALLRSSRANRSWVVAAAAVLDSAALLLSCLDLPRDPQAAIVVRSGALSLRQICTLFRLPFNPDPHFPEYPIAVTREEFDEVFDELTAIGLPMVADRDTAWLDFAGWRVNYDEAVLGLAGLTLAPPAPWSSDRGLRYPHSPAG